ncbi:recombinase family protein [Bradyrhizobium sp. Tv2a-2]|uniref:recombinase family protein n=1 Tax=Bradyrhizobium sp. Tv2a-2 TaxID=113395 RepID=UPI000429BDA3|nr:recombinase family protein [Bradyrhizobium sp. Tv2a-2]
MLQQARMNEDNAAHLRYARGGISLKEAVRKAHEAGLLYPKSGAKVPVSTVHTILRNRLYTGWFEWNGKLIQGKHEALVPVELWERVQGVLDGRFVKKAKRGRHDFAFSGMIACHACGCAVVGEIKKERYVYYHCTGYADECQGNPACCRRKYVREEASAKSNGIRTPTNPTRMKASRFSTSLATLKGCSRSRNRAKNAAC